jgi:hypothetical protein
MRYWLRPTPARVDEAAAEALTRAAAYRVLLLSLARKPVQLLPPEPPVEPRPLVDQLLDALTVCPCAPSRPAAA